MGRYLVRRLLQAIPVLLGATLIIFLLVFALSGDPLQALSGDRRLSPAVAAQLREEYHLNDPWYVQYWYYISGVFSGDFGETYTGREVAEIMSERFPVTLKLTGLAFLIEAVLGVLAGVLAALRKGKFLDQLVLLSTLLLISIPIFVLGSIMQLMVGVKWDLLPVTYKDDEAFTSLLMPAFVLAATSTAYLARLMRTSLMDTMGADYVRTAVAKGLRRERVLGRHAVRTALIPVVTYLGYDLGSLMGGAIITEKIFNIPGVGSQLFQSVYLREQTTVVGFVTVLILVYILANLLVDFLYAVLDPRIRYD
ncbi:ABC transporter permease [Streptomyces boninensis]|uniref:ABC transporter permease n=1 Tax=Streptomyces boninensis TaxID=2039455 RepID=UPI003B21D6A6